MREDDLDREAGFAGLHINKSLARSFRNFIIILHLVTSIMSDSDDSDDSEEDFGTDPEYSGTDSDSEGKTCHQPTYI